VPCDLSPVQLAADSNESFEESEEWRLSCLCPVLGTVYKRHFVEDKDDERRDALLRVDD
jgi:hypothetical protein